MIEHEKTLKDVDDDTLTLERAVSGRDAAKIYLRTGDGGNGFYATPEHLEEILDFYERSTGRAFTRKVTPVTPDSPPAVDERLVRAAKDLLRQAVPGQDVPDLVVFLGRES